MPSALGVTRLQAKLAGKSKEGRQVLVDFWGFAAPTFVPQTLYIHRQK